MGKEIVGTFGCGCCAKEVVVKRNERGTLSYSCAWCDHAEYVKAGTMAHGYWLKRIKPIEGAAPAETKPEPAPAATPAPAAKPESPKVEGKPKPKAGTFLTLIG